MKMFRISVLIAFGLLLLVFTFPIVGQSRIVVNGAHTVRTVNTVSSSTLNNLLGGVQARVVAEFANSTFHPTLIAPPNTLQTLLSGILSRVVFQFASANRYLTLAYPHTLLNDQTAPVVSGFNNTFDGSTKITWTTDEFARCTVHYGTQPGNYTGTIEETLYAKQHEATLVDAVAGTTYYVQITGTDQSGNVVNSAEFSFTVVTTRSVFLPLVRR